MRASKEQTQADTTQLIENPVLYRLSVLRELGQQVIRNYHETWTRHAGIEMTFDEAERKVRSFHPQNTFLLTDKGKTRVVAQIHTLTVHASSLEELIERYPSYASVENDAKNPPAPDANILICFSINCQDGTKIKLPDRIQSPERTIIRMLPPMSKIAYSYMNIPYANVSSTDMLNKYLSVIRNHDTRSGGPVFMHEAFGGIAMAFLEHSRPQHIRAGEGNVLVVYPNDESQVQLFNQAKTQRLMWNSDDSIRDVIHRNNALLFTDILQP